MNLVKNLLHSLSALLAFNNPDTDTKPLKVYLSEVFIYTIEVTIEGGSRMNIGFIGIGNMAGAIIKGLIQSKQVASSNIYATNRTPEKLHTFCKETGIQPVSSNEELAETSDLLFIGAKPKDCPAILTELREKLKNKKTVIVSMAAGIHLEQLSSYIGEEELPIIRIMPNLNSSIQESMTAVCGNRYATKEHVDEVVSLCNAIGQTSVIPEDQFSIFSAIAGCSPAFTFLYIDALARAAVRHGMSKETATQIAAQAVLGSGKLVRESTDSPMNLADQVASPGGTTIEGVLQLLNGSFYEDITGAVDAAFSKDQHLLNKS